jgi:hypothetical protein
VVLKPKQHVKVGNGERLVTQQKWIIGVEQWDE